MGIMTRMSISIKFKPHLSPIWARMGWFFGIEIIQICRPKIALLKPEFFAVFLERKTNWNAYIASVNMSDWTQNSLCQIIIDRNFIHAILFKVIFFIHVKWLEYISFYFILSASNRDVLMQQFFKKMFWLKCVVAVAWKRRCVQ